MNDASRVELDALAALADPRRYAVCGDDAGTPEDVAGVDPAPGRPDPVAALHAIAAQGIAAPTWAAEAAGRNAAVDALEALVRDGDAGALVRAVECAPSLAVARYLWRALEAADGDPRADARESERTLATTLFALPVVFVAAADSPVSDGVRSRAVSGVIHEPERLAALLREHRAFGACETFAVAGTLATAETIGLARLPELLAAARPDVAGTALAIEGSGERVFLRFLVGALLAAPGVDPLQSAAPGTWGPPFAQALQASVATRGVSLLALPLPPRRLVTALRSGRAAQREVAAQVFASNAIRKFRARVGEPTAIISAHHAPDAPGGGELRLSLSSPFDPREAEGLRVALYPYEAVADVAAMLVELLGDCQVADLRIEPGVHPDLDPATGLRRLFKNEGPQTGAARAH